jgi:hypothetical protein
LLANTVGSWFTIILWIFWSHVAAEYFLRGISSVQETILVLAFVVDLNHRFIHFLKAVVCEEDVQGLLVVKLNERIFTFLGGGLHALSDHG